MALQQKGNWLGKTIGIVGAGNVGSALARRVKKLGLDLVIHDPFLEESHELAGHLVPLEDALNQDIVSFHTPLTKKGFHPTYHLLNQQNLAALKNDAILINTSRGAVIDNNALAEYLVHHPGISVALDVWEGEPVINDSLVEMASIATPHIAGYSLKGKLLGTEMIYREFCRVFSFQNENSIDAVQKKELLMFGAEDEAVLFNKILLQAYGISEDFLTANDISHLISLPARFDEMRNTYKFRPEYCDFSFDRGAVSGELADRLVSSGFRVT